MGVVLAELGIPSEVWILRQCQEFDQIEPVVFYWKMADNPAALPPGLETHKFSTPFTRPRTWWSRVTRRLGSKAAVLPDDEQRADIRRALLGANLSAVQCHFSWSGLPISAALDGDLPVLWQVHGHDVTTLMQDLAYRKCVAEALPKVDFLAAVGTFQLELLRPYGLTQRHGVIPCGAPLSVFAQRPVPIREPG
ncbi:hypothetical protein, partial [Phenylobacterium sp.]|uniref:hypothetical protein n=1 Tax=Phenylobacterium sp. TaxID=1871053 RepID=UPI00286B4D8E